MACMYYQLAKKQTINFPLCGQFMVSTRSLWLVHGKLMVCVCIVNKP